MTFESEVIRNDLAWKPEIDLNISLPFFDKKLAKANWSKQGKTTKAKGAFHVWPEAI